MWLAVPCWQHLDGPGVKSRILAARVRVLISVEGPIERKLTLKGYLRFVMHSDV